jgi:hypothetical protein
VVNEVSVTGHYGVHGGLKQPKEQAKRDPDTDQPYQVFWAGFFGRVAHLSSPDSRQERLLQALLV